MFTTFGPPTGSTTYLGEWAMYVKHPDGRWTYWLVPTAR